MRTTYWLVAAALVAGSAAPLRAANVGNPSAVNLKIFGAWVSRSETCSDPIAIFTDAGAVYRDMMTNPTFGSGSIPNGSYPCVIFKVSDAIKTTSAFTSTAGNCVAGHEYVQDIFRGGESSTCPDGTSVSGATNATGTEQQPCIYFRTGATSGNGAFSPATAIPISSAWTVQADSEGTFVMDFTGKMVDSTPSPDCGVDPPVMSFR